MNTVINTIQNTQHEEEQKEAKRKHEYFLKRKNLLDLDNEMQKRHDKFMELLKQHDVTYEQVFMGLVPHQINDEVKEYFRHAAITNGAIEYAKKKAHQSGELATFEKEYEADSKITQKKEIDQKAYTDAAEAYKANPSKKNTAEMIKTRFNLNGEGIAGTVKKSTQELKEEMRTIEQTLLEKYQKTNEETAGEEQEIIERLKKSQDPQEQRVGEVMERNALRKKANAEDMIFEEQEEEAWRAQEARDE